jgi:ubiquinone/menaquinone biosynthesis C-methylase UbiE
MRSSSGVTDPWSNRSFLRGTQYKTDANLTARQSIYAYQHPRIDLQARVLDLAAPGPADTIVDVGCGNGTYLAELAGRGFTGRVLGVDLSLGMLTAARRRLSVLAERNPPRPGASAESSSDGTGTPGPSNARESANPALPAGLPTGPPAGPPGPVTLVNADATALPLRDGVADLALAPHMLYHVPDPVDALHELRRATRPDGRVVIVLNGAGHLRQLRAAVAAARGEDVKTMGERVTLDDGESLARSLFPEVTRHDFVAELRVPSPGPIADYLRSMPGTSHHAVPERLIETVVAALPRTPEGHYVITSHAGCLVAERR